MDLSKNDVIAHNVRFYDVDARPIQCMAIQRESKKLALSRSDNSVEIWDINWVPHLQKTITGKLTQSVECIKWFKNRLFSCGKHGYVVEYDCLREAVMHSTPVTGGPAWCLDIFVKNELLACGTEEGHINLFQITDYGLEHYKFMDRQQGRILCISWDKSGQHLVTGSINSIRVWNVESGHAIHKMTTGRTDNQKETIVWSLAVTSDLTIISGDSRGCLTFWDGKVGVQSDSYKTHAADILTVVLSEDETTVYSSGVDPNIVSYVRLVEGKTKWSKGMNKRAQEHDVSALAVSSDVIYSGGNDSYLTAIKIRPKKLLLKFPPHLKGPCVKTSPSKRYLLLRYLNRLEVWKLGQPSNIQKNCDSALKLSENQTLLLKLKAKDDEAIVAASMSDDGCYIAYSTDLAVKFFKFSMDESPSLDKIRTPNNDPCRLITFYEVKNKQHCALATKGNEISIIEIIEDELNVIHNITPLSNQTLTDTISHLIVSPDGNYLAAADCSGNVAVWSQNDWSLFCTLPRRRSSVSAIAINKRTNNVVLTYSDSKINEFSLKDKAYTPFSKIIMHRFPKNRHSVMGNVTFDERRNTAVIVHDDSLLCVFDESKVWNSEKSKKQKLEGTDGKDEEECKKLTNYFEKYKYIVAVDWLGKGEMVIVSFSPVSLSEKLPPALKRKIFGT